MLPKGSITSTTTIHETNYKLNVVTSHITIPRKKFDFFQFDFRWDEISPRFHQWLGEIHAEDI